MENPNTNEIRGIAKDSNTIITDNGNEIKTSIPESMIGKNIVKRGNTITERIDS